MPPVKLTRVNEVQYVNKVNLQSLNSQIAGVNQLDSRSEYKCIGSACEDPSQILVSCGFVQVE